MLDPRLNHVVAVARYGSFTGAAEAVGVTQSAVTKGVADLERQLGYSLFHRTARGALLTEKGRDFAERAARLLEDTRELLEGSSVKGDPFAGVLRIGVCPASLESQLIEPIGKLQSRHPSIRVDLSGASFERMVQQLRNGGVDVAIGLDAAFQEWPDLQIVTVGELSCIPFVRLNHPLLSVEQVQRSQIAEYDFVCPSDSRPYGAIIRDLYQDHGDEWRKRVHIIDFFPLVQRIVAGSNAIGVVDVSHARSPSFRRRFATLNGTDLFPPMPMCCATRVRWEPSPAVRAFISAARSALSGGHSLAASPVGNGIDLK